jgi:hypothetical protein
VLYLYIWRNDFGCVTPVLLERQWGGVGAGHWPPGCSVQPFMRSQYSLSWSGNFSPYIEPEDSVPCSQQPLVLSHVKHVHTTKFFFFKTDINIYIRLRLGFSSGFFHSSFQTNILLSYPHSCYVHRPSHFSYRDHANGVWRTSKNYVLSFLKE